MLNVTTIIFWCFSLAGLSFWKTPFTLTVSYLIIQMGKSQKYVVSSLLDGQSKDNKPYTSSSSSASPRVWSDTQKIYTAEWYAPDVAPSTLIWLMGAKDLLEDSVPELGAFCIIFISLSKVIRNYICFVSLRSVIGPKNWGHPLKTSLHQPIQKREKL